MDQYRFNDIGSDILLIDCGSSGPRGNFYDIDCQKRVEFLDKLKLTPNQQKQISEIKTISECRESLKIYIGKIEDLLNKSKNISKLENTIQIKCYLTGDLRSKILEYKTELNSIDYLIRIKYKGSVYGIYLDILSGECEGYYQQRSCFNNHRINNKRIIDRFNTYLNPNKSTIHFSKLFILNMGGNSSQIYYSSVESFYPRSYRFGCHSNLSNLNEDHIVIKGLDKCTRDLHKILREFKTSTLLITSSCVATRIESIAPLCKIDIIELLKKKLKMGLEKEILNRVFFFNGVSKNGIWEDNWTDSIACETIHNLYSK